MSSVTKVSPDVSSRFVATPVRCALRFRASSIHVDCQAAAAVVVVVAVAEVRTCWNYKPCRADRNRFKG